MPSTRLEDYALIGDLHSAALVSRQGSIDWLCLPRFDSEACFAALLGRREHGRWLIAPAETPTQTMRRYLPNTLIVETRHETVRGVVLVTDFMRERDGEPALIRLVRGERGQVTMQHELIIRFGYGSIIPWVKKVEGGLEAIAGPNLVQVLTPVAMRGEDLRTVGDFTVRAGETIPFVLTWYPSHAPKRVKYDADTILRETEGRWIEWSNKCVQSGPYEEPIRRSLLVLKALTFKPTGGIVAAPTTSLPEWPGGARNWDYRFCWLRDATFTLYALMTAGYDEEASAWREWLLRAVAGAPSQVRTLYGIAGERDLQEYELTWLPGYDDSRPVRVGNGAATQLQLDVFGEVMGTLYLARHRKLTEVNESWSIETALLEYLETIWRDPDEGIWEVRGPRRDFTHSKVMAWVAFDRAVKSIEEHGLPGPRERWRAVRDEVHAAVCAQGFDTERGSFMQYYGSKTVDASLLMIPLVNFLPVTDPRVAGTIKAIEEDLLTHGFVARYRPDRALDGQAGREGVFLPCSFWLVDAYVLQGRLPEARALFDRLLALSNDVGLIAEEYDPESRRLLGNFPQAFSHVALVRSATNLTRAIAESAVGSKRHAGKSD